jgi:chromosome segregation ATPase
MPKAIVVAVGDTPLNPLNDLLKQNSISSKVVDATTSSVDEIDKLIQADDQCQCVLLKGVSSLGQHIPRIADATEKLVLLYCSPATALANALEASNGTVKPEQVINRWQESVSQAMATVEESELYSLCDLNDVLEHSSLFLKEFFVINKAAEFKPSTYTKKQFANHLATLYLFEQDDAFALYDEALSIGKLFGEFMVHLGPDTDEIKQSAAESGQSVFKQLISNHQEIQSKHNEIESLKAQSSEKVNALEKQIAELQHTKAAFEENSIELQQELTKNKELAEQQASKIEALQDSKQNIETKLQAVTAQIEKSQNEMTALASELSAKEASLTENQERLTNLQSQLQGKEQRNTQLQSQIEELKASSAKLNEELSQQRQVITESDKDKAAKTAALQELENKLQSVNQRVSELNSEKIELTNTVQQLNEQLVNQQSVNEEKEKECKATKRSLQETQQQLHAAKTNVTELKAQQDELTSTIEELKQQLANQQTVIEDKDKECKVTKSSLQETQQQLHAAKTNVTELKAQQDELTSTIEELKQQLVNQQSATEDKDKECKATRNSLQETQQQLQAAKTNVTELNAQQDELTSTIEELKQQRANQQTVIEDKDKECKVTKSSLQETQQQLHAAKTNVTELKAQQDELTSTIEELKQQLANQQSVIEDKEYKATKKSLQETQQQLHAAKTNVTDLKAQQDELTSKIEQLEEQLANQQSATEEKDKECKATKKSLQETQQQLQAAKTNITELKAQQDELTSKIEQLEEQIQSQQIVIEEKQEAITLKDSAIKKYENQLNTSHQKISQLETNLVELQTQHQQVISSKDKEFAALSNSLTQTQTALEESTNSLVKLKEENTVTSQEFELATIQVGQLQEELESTFAELQRARTAEALHEETRSKLAAVTQQVEQLIQDKELADLQISQLQEELESAFAELQQARATEALHEETRSKFSAVTQQIEQLVQDKKLAEQKTSQLQEELKLITVQKADLEAASSLNENVIAEQSQQIDVLTQKNEELTVQSSSLKQQVEAATKRKGLEEQALVNELQAQLEQQLKKTQLLENNNARLQEQLKQSEAGMSQNNEFQQAELELASLQISQLQEELEYYYNAWQESQQNGTQVIKMGKHHQKVFSKAQAESLVVTGKYSEDGYQDAHFMLNNVLLGDGRSFAELPVKLVRVGEHVAIEFRDEEQGGLFQHFEDATDEYGPYLRYFANPPESNVEQQTRVYSRMNSSERVLVMSSIALLAELIQEQEISCSVSLSNEEWRTWRLSAIELVDTIEQQPNWLSFDRVALKEEYRTDGYEHLWLSFEKVLVGEFWKEHLELKIAATDVSESGGESFCEDISLEFREAADGTPPLLTWPAETEDEYGPKYVVSISNLNELADIASTDKTLIFHLANNLPSILDKLDERGAAMSRPKSDWKAASSLELNNANVAQEVKSQDEYSALVIEEVISMGSYQHVLFAYQDQDTKVKLKAQNINPDTFDAELFIELRNGTPEIIYNSTEFFGEDEFGPRVLIPAESYFGDILSSRIHEFEWLEDTYNKAINELESGEGIDELVKRLWLNMLKRKQTLL